jgi:hypothetical protein
MGGKDYYYLVGLGIVEVDGNTILMRTADRSSIITGVVALDGDRLRIDDRNRGHAAPCL